MIKWLRLGSYQLLALAVIIVHELLGLYLHQLLVVELLDNAQLVWLVENWRLGSRNKLILLLKVYVLYVLDCLRCIDIHVF
jgi:hypothetical protein